MKWWAARRRGLRWTPGGIAARGLAPAAARVLVPAGDWLAHLDAGRPATTPPTARAAARGRVLAFGAGLLATGALVVTARSLALSRAGQVSGRYAQALEQLGCEELDVRIGGIRALEHVARDSPRHHPAVMEMLAAFIRERSRQHWPPPHPGGQARERSPRPDVAAITGRGPRTARDLSPVDLAGADLTGADLTGADRAARCSPVRSWPGRICSPRSSSARTFAAQTSAAPGLPARISMAPTSPAPTSPRRSRRRESGQRGAHPRGAHRRAGRQMGQFRRAGIGTLVLASW